MEQGPRPGKDARLQGDHFPYARRSNGDISVISRAGKGHPIV
jgi:hypothetical protein